MSAAGIISLLNQRGLIVQSSMSNRQMGLSIIIICTAMASVNIAQAMALHAGRGAWVTLLLTALIFGLMATVIIRLGRMYEGKTLFEYSRNIAGNAMPYVLGVFLVLYFIVFDALLCTSLSRMIQANFLFKTPQWALIIVLLPILGIIAHKGLQVAARLAEIFCIWFLVIVLIIDITMLFEGRLNYLLPLFNISDSGKYLFSIKDAYPGFLGISVFYLIPMTKQNRKAPRTVFLGIMGVFVYYVLSVYGPYAMIGVDEIVYHDYALIDAIRLVEYPGIEFLQRVDVLFLTFGLIRTIIGKAFFYTVIVELLCKMIPKAKRIVIVVIVGVAFALVTIPLTGVTKVTELLCRILSIGGLFAAGVMPLTLFLIAKVKKHGKKNA